MEASAAALRYIGRRIPMPDVPHPLQLVGGGRDDSTAVERELQRLRSEIEARNRQETAIAELGQAALTGVDPIMLLGQACALVELTLGIDNARALELTAGGRVTLCPRSARTPPFFTATVTRKRTSRSRSTSPSPA